MEVLDKDWYHYQLNKTYAMLVSKCIKTARIKPFIYKQSVTKTSIDWWFMQT